MGTYLQEKLLIELQNSSRDKGDAPPHQARDTLLLVYMRPKPSLSPGSHKDTEDPRSPHNLLKVEGRDYIERKGTYFCLVFFDKVEVISQINSFPRKTACISATMF